MQPIELPNGNLLIPARAEGPDWMIGDAVREIGPDDPEFQVWSDWLRSRHTDAEAQLTRHRTA